jgi:uncharacterized protein YdcH (DUF465 family)
MSNHFFEAPGPTSTLDDVVSAIESNQSSNSDRLDEVQSLKNQVNALMDSIDSRLNHIQVLLIVLTVVVGAYVARHW